MANQDEDQLAAAEAGAGGRPATEGAVSTGEAPASGDGTAAAPGAAGDQRGAEGNGRPELTEDPGAGAGGQLPGAAGGPAAQEEDDAPGGRGGDDAEAGDSADPQLPAGLAHRPAGFAAGYAEPDPLAYPGDAPADRGGAGYEPGDQAAGPGWLPGEAAPAGAQASPYAQYGEYDPYPAQGQEENYGGYGQPPGYGYDQEYGPEGSYDPERGYVPSDSYGQAYPSADYGEGQGYGAADVYAEDQGYDDGYGQGYSQERPYGNDQGYGRGYGQPQDYDQGYGQPQAYSQAEPYGRQPYAGGPSYAPDQGYGQEPGYGGPGPQQGYAEPEAGWAAEPAAEQRSGRDAGPDDEEAPDQRQGQSGDQPQAGGQVRADGQDRDGAQGQRGGQAGGGSEPQGGQAESGGSQAGSEAQAGGQAEDGGAARGGAGGQTGAQAQTGAQVQPGTLGAPGGPMQAQPPGREPDPGSAAPYPPQDSYRWPSAYQAPAQSAPAPGGPGPYDVQDAYRDPAGGRGGAGPAARPHGAETAYPPHPPQAGSPRPAAPQAQGADTLAPLPAQAPDQQQAAETADDLTAEALLHGKSQAPGAGWRRLVYKTSGGLIRPRESAETLRRRELMHRVRTPVAGGHHRVAVMSLKGGVGKTTTTVGLGAMLASLRGDRIIALDANPDRGTLSDKVRLETAATVRDMLNERSQIRRYADVRAFTSQAPSRLEVLASDRDPTVSVAFCEEDYYDAARVLEHYYSISLIDCGTGLLHSAMAGVLRLADQIILVSSPSVDGARSASATLDWLDAHAYGDLVRNGVVVLSMIRPRSKSTVDLDRLEHHFAGRCRAVVRIPYDGHLEEGAEVDLDEMSPATVDAYLMLAATVGDGFAWPRRAARQPAPPQDWDRRDLSNGAARRYR